MQLKSYVVESPEYGTYDCHPGGREPVVVRDFAEVRAQNKQHAKWVACKLWETQFDSYPRKQRGEHKHPLTGVQAWTEEELEAIRQEA